MAKQYVSTRNLQFLLHEVFNSTQLNQFERYQDYDREAFDMMMEASKQLSDQYLFPYYTEMDKQKAYFEDGVVKVHPALKKAIKAIAEGGWISANKSYEQGGQQMPLVLLNAALLIMYSANANAAAYAFLTQGASNLIQSFGSDELKSQYIPEMYAGNWQGTMALTEPQAGSSLIDLTSSAELTEAGHYKISGQKIYISGGDHDAADNIVHLLLARIKGAPAGTKGISLFVVPKKRIENGSLVSNDVTTAGLFGKMGQKGYVAAHLMLGEKEDCHGYIVGEPNMGLRYMFQMMNEARIATGLLATGTASGAYFAALQYSQERAQGRHPSSKDPLAPPVLIIEHADVRRMLLFQKAVVEGSASLLLQCSYYADLAEVETGEAKQNAHLLLELLTPIAKSYPAEMSIRSVSEGMQCLGGAGYCDDFPLEQYYRDVRINAIYEGTTTIHGMDLLGRKVLMQDGKALKLLSAEIEQVIAGAMAEPELAPMAKKLGNALQELGATTYHLMGLAQKERPEVFLADATLYLEFFGIVVLGWQWLKQGQSALAGLRASSHEDEKHFYEGKLLTLRFFMEYELPKTLGMKARLWSEERVTMETQAAHLNF